MCEGIRFASFYPEAMHGESPFTPVSLLSSVGGISPTP